MCARMTATVVPTRQGEVLAWGINDFGQLGNGSTFYETSPTQVQRLVVLSSFCSSQAQMRKQGMRCSAQGVNAPTPVVLYYVCCADRHAFSHGLGSCKAGCMQRVSLESALYRYVCGGWVSYMACHRTLGVLGTTYLHTNDCAGARWWAWRVSKLRT